MNYGASLLSDVYSNCKKTQSNVAHSANDKVQEFTPLIAPGRLGAKGPREVSADFVVDKFDIKTNTAINSMSLGTFQVPASIHALDLASYANNEVGVNAFKEWGGDWKLAPAINTRWVCSSASDNFDCYNVIHVANSKTTNYMVKATDLLGHGQRIIKDMKIKHCNGDMITGITVSTDGSFPMTAVDGGKGGRPVLGGFGVSSVMCTGVSNESQMSGPAKTEIVTTWPNDTSAIQDAPVEITYKASAFGTYMDSLAIFWQQHNQFQKWDRNDGFGNETDGMFFTPMIFGVRPIGGAETELKLQKSNTQQHVRNFWSPEMLKPVNKGAANDYYTTLDYVRRPWSESQKKGGADTLHLCPSGHFVHSLTGISGKYINENEWFVMRYKATCTDRRNSNPNYQFGVEKGGQYVGRGDGGEYCRTNGGTRYKEITEDSWFGFSALGTTWKNSSLTNFLTYKLSGSDQRGTNPKTFNDKVTFTEGSKDTNVYRCPYGSTTVGIRYSQRESTKKGEFHCFPGDKTKTLGDDFEPVCAATPTSGENDSMYATIFRCPFVGMGLTDAPVQLPILSSFFSAKPADKLNGFAEPEIALRCAFPKLCLTYGGSYVGINGITKEAKACDGYCARAWRECFSQFKTSSMSELGKYCRMLDLSKDNLKDINTMQNVLKEKGSNFENVLNAFINQLPDTSPFRKASSFLMVQLSGFSGKVRTVTRDGSNIKLTDWPADSPVKEALIIEKLLGPINSASAHEYLPNLKRVDGTYKWMSESSRSVEKYLHEDAPSSELVRTQCILFDANLAAASDVLKSFLATRTLLRSTEIAAFTVGQWTDIAGGPSPATVKMVAVLELFGLVVQRTHQNESRDSVKKVVNADKIAALQNAVISAISRPQYKAVYGKIIELMANDFLNLFHTKNDAWKSPQNPYKDMPFLAFDFLVYHWLLIASMGSMQYFPIPSTKLSYDEVKAKYSNNAGIGWALDDKINTVWTTKTEFKKLIPGFTCSIEDKDATKTKSRLVEAVKAALKDTVNLDKVPSLCCATEWNYAGQIGDFHRFCCGGFDSSKKTCNAFAAEGVKQTANFARNNPITIPKIFEELCNQETLKGLYTEAMLKDSSVMADLLNLNPTTPLYCDRTNKVDGKNIFKMSSESTAFKSPDKYTGLKLESLYQYDLEVGLPSENKSSNGGNAGTGNNDTQGGGGGGGGDGGGGQPILTANGTIGRISNGETTVSIPRDNAAVVTSTEEVTPPAPPPPPADSSSSSSSSSTGGNSGGTTTQQWINFAIFISVLVGVGLLVCGGIFFYRRSKKQKEEKMLRNLLLR